MYVLTEQNVLCQIVSNEVRCNIHFPLLQVVWSDFSEDIYVIFIENLEQ